MHHDSDESRFEQDAVPPWQQWLAECRNSFGKAPRSFDGATEKRLLVNPPWITKLYFRDPLAQLVQNSTLRNVFRNGTVVWGYVIQANAELFEPSPSAESYTFDRPGEIVFSPLGGGAVTPQELEPVASRLAGLRDAKKLNAELQSWADYLLAETTRVVGKPVPSRIASGNRYFVSTTLFRRSHLPGGVLCSPALPIVVAPQQPYFAMALPQDFWSVAMLNWWFAGA
jgi:hypothetical protein